MNATTIEADGRRESMAFMCSSSGWVPWSSGLQPGNDANCARFYKLNPPVNGSPVCSSTSWWSRSTSSGAIV
jgi:hypothetical protein